MNVKLPLPPVPETVQFAHHPLVLEDEDYVMENIFTFWVAQNTALTAGGFVLVNRMKDLWSVVPDWG